MYFQRDYILRMIEMLGEFMREILDLARDADAQAELDEVSRKASGMPLKLLKTAGVPTLESILSPEQRYLCAELLLLSAQVDARTRPDDETAPTRAQAHRADKGSAANLNAHGKRAVLRAGFGRFNVDSWLRRGAQQQYQRKHGCCRHAQQQRRV